MSQLQSPKPQPSHYDEVLDEQRQQSEQEEEEEDSGSEGEDGSSGSGKTGEGGGGGGGLGQEVRQAFAHLEENVHRLHQHLEKQFNDSEEEEEEEEEEGEHNTAGERGEFRGRRGRLPSSSGEELSSEGEEDEDTSDGAEQLDEIIHMLNRQEELEEELRQQKDKFPHSTRSPGSGYYEDYEMQSTTSTSEEDGEEDNDGRPQQFVGKIFDLIENLQSRQPNPTLDEWDNDDDAGYITITLTEPEFFDYEDTNAAKLIAEREAAKQKKVQERESAASPSSPSVSQLTEGGSFGQPFSTTTSSSSPVPPTSSSSDNQPEEASSPIHEDNNHVDNNVSAVPANPDYVPKYHDPFQLHQNDVMQPTSRRQSVGERRRSEIIGQHKFHSADNMHCFFNLKVIFEPYRTGFEESKDLKHPKGTILAGRYEVYDVLGSAAFSTALQCIDLVAEEHESQWVCLKVIKNNKDFFDQSLDEIKLLQYINSKGDPDHHRVLRLIDFFYYKEHLFIVSELLKENLYEFGRYIRENMLEYYYTLPRLKRISKQILEALSFIHSLNLIHCDVKPENIVIKSFSKCEIKLIDFGSSCFTTDHLTTYIQSRSYRAPEVIIGHPYDARIDIWSVGAVLAELYTGYVLFQNDSVPTMLSRITGILGNFPEHVLQQGKDTGKYFTLNNIVYERDEEGNFHLIFPKMTNLASRLHFQHRHYKHLHPNPADLKDEELFVDFIRVLLHLDPKKRPTANEALKHPWLSDADTVYFKEYIIGQPAVPPQQQQAEYEEQGEEDEEGYEEEEDGVEVEEEDENDKALKAALNYAKYALGPDEEEEEGVTFQRSQVLQDAEDSNDDNATEDMNDISLDDEIAEYEAEAGQEEEA